MQIGETRHEHAATSQVYTYHADYDVDTHAITWSATVRNGADGEWRLDGSIPLSSPGIASVAEEVVRDAVVAQIDALEVDGAGPSP
ncbi:hypothetical protein [Piscinibacter terrae]|nr:hypothetical protein [Albitalea terrae]